MDMSASPADELGNLPEWDLSVFYRGVADPQITADMASLRGQVSDFAETYRGKVAAKAADPDGGDQLAAAISIYEALEDRMGRIASYAGLIFASSSMVPEHARFYGDMQTALTELNSDLLFFGLELNGLGDEVISQLTASSSAFAHYLPWVNDLRLHREHDLSTESEQLM